MTEPSFTEEDREVLAALADNYDAVPNMHDGRLIARAAAYIDHLEGALESVCNVGDRAAVQVARASLPTSKEDAG